MANNYSIQAEDIEPGKQILVQGKLNYARLTRLIMGPDLLAVNARRAQNGLDAIEQAHTTVTVSQAVVLAGDPQFPSLEEKFIHERLYVSKTKPENGLSYSVNDKFYGDNPAEAQLPAIMIKNAEGKFEQDTSGRDLAVDLDVTLLLHTFASKNRRKRGIGLSAVLVNEPVRYYESTGVNTNDLASRGIVFASPIRPVIAGSVPNSGNIAPVQSGGAPPANTMTNSNGFAMPSPTIVAPVVAAPLAQPQGFAQPVAQPVPVASVQAQPVAAPAPVAAAQPAPVSNAGLSIEAQIAALQAQQATAPAAPAAQSTVSAFGQASAASPWPANDGISYQP